MYHIHHTNALILGSTARGEANRVFTLLTRELGLIHAVAQGVRLGKSKLRYALTDYAYAHIDLVHGKEAWRITSATPMTSYPNIRSSVRGVALLAQVSKLVRRTIRGESEYQEDLFDDIRTAYEFLESGEHTDQAYDAVEITLVLRILRKLGYVASEAAPGDEGGFDPAKIDVARFDKKPLLVEINRALHESHL